MSYPSWLWWRNVCIIRHPCVSSTLLLCVLENKFTILLHVSQSVKRGWHVPSRAVAFDTGYAGSNGLEPQSWVNGNGTSYIYFGSGEFDGQGSGHDFYGTLYMPPSGYVNSCDGGRSHTYCDYRQQ